MVTKKIANEKKKHTSKSEHKYKRLVSFALFSRWTCRHIKGFPKIKEGAISIKVRFILAFNRSNCLVISTAEMKPVLSFRFRIIHTHTEFMYLFQGRIKLVDDINPFWTGRWISHSNGSQNLTFGQKWLEPSNEVPLIYFVILTQDFPGLLLTEWTRVIDQTISGQQLRTAKWIPSQLNLNSA